MKMKKILFIATATVSIVCSVLCIMASNFKNYNDYLLEENVEALTDGESATPKMPCIRATSNCQYVIQGAVGNLYLANTPGMRHI